MSMLLYGDILSNLTGDLVGSLGLAPSINCNQQQAMAQAAHGSAPDIAGKKCRQPNWDDAVGDYADSMVR